ncbi:hypothetical protein [Streptomyces sp. NPDC059076]|uniref:hypothetical protein n=1 Tax=unclassified Streptomyces TaxID=2593676 RepID=UPI0036C43389
MQPSTLRALRRAAELTRQNRFAEAVLLTEPVFLTASDQECIEIRRWLVEHISAFTPDKETCTCHRLRTSAA